MRGPEYLHSPTKRRIDFAMASLLLTASSPLFVAMYIENTSREQPLFFRQERIGENGKPFEMIKFETLYAGAEQEKAQLEQMHSLSHKQKELKETRTPNNRMRFLRSTGLNELPQTVNILKGEMSIVGPRPQPLYLIKFAEGLFPDITQVWKETALTVTPGFLGVRPLETRALPVDQFNITAEADIEYFHNATIMRDFQVIYQALRGLSS